jgi:hypothetical protein
MATTKSATKKAAGHKQKQPEKLKTPKKAVAKKLATAKRKKGQQAAPNTATIHQFSPRPRHSAKWWKRQDTVFGGGPIATVSVPGLISAKTWLLSVIAEVGPGADGSFCVFFPTITDCLLWFRWQAIPRDKYTLAEGEFTPEEIAENSKFNAALAKKIDKTKPNTDAYKLFKALESDLLGLLRDRELCGHSSIHEYLTKLGSLEAWRRALQSDQITFEGWPSGAASFRK